MRISAAFIALALATPVAAAQRIASTNPCADSILMEVADPRQIVAISHYSQDPRSSSISRAQAQRFRSTSGTAEELVALRPSMVIADTLMAPATVQALRRMGIPLVQLPVPESFAQNRAQVAVIAAAVGHPERGTALNRRIDAAVAATRVTRGTAIPILLWQGSGLVLGTGTLADALIRNLGFTNRSPDYGFGKWGMLSLESLIANPPELLLLGGPDADAGGGDRLLDHPALRALKHRIAIEHVSSRLFRCGGPSIIAATERLAKVRREIGR